MVATLDYHLKEAPPELFDGIRWTLLTFFILHANERNRCWPSMRGLAERLGKSLPYLTEAKQWLIEHGAIRLVPYKERVGEKEQAVSKRQHMYELSGKVKFGEKAYPYLHLPDKHGDDTCAASMDQPGLTSTPLNINPVDDQRGSPLTVSNPIKSTKPRKESEKGSKPPQLPTVSQVALAGVEVAIIGDGSESAQPLSLTVSPPAAPTRYRWLYSSVSDASMHLIEDRGKRTNIQQQHTLCGSPVQHRTTFAPGLQCLNHQCPDCEHIAREVNLLTYALQHVTGADANLNSGVRELARDLQKSGYKAEDVAAYEVIWRKGWQYQKNPGEKPGLQWVREHIGAVKSDTGLSKYDPSYELQARIREARQGESPGNRRVYDPLEDDEHPALLAGVVVEQIETTHEAATA